MKLVGQGRTDRFASVTTGSLSYSDSYLYDAFSRLKTAQEANAAPNKGGQQVYVYDGLSNRAMVELGRL